MPPSQAEVIQAYRNLYKHLLRAVQYSKPARFTARDHLRRSFRKSDPDDYDEARITRTLELLDSAATSKGLEHRMVKNLMHVWWEQRYLGGSPLYGPYMYSLTLHADVFAQKEGTYGAAQGGLPRVSPHCPYAERKYGSLHWEEQSTRLS